LNHYGIKRPLISYYEHNRFTRIPQIIAHLNDGKDVALISDAGTPGISDPAYKLTRAAITEDIKVETIPGPSAALAGLIASGLPSDRFLFEGFLPPKKGREKRLNALKDEQATIVFYESPRRLKRTLMDIAEIIGDRPAVVARELTKMNEEIIRGTVSKLISYFSKHDPRGEIVLIIGKPDPNVFFK
jgi:16S rRNA (cytidine1402-2'-O)-methyltransferase